MRGAQRGGGSAGSGDDASPSGGGANNKQPLKKQRQSSPGAAPSTQQPGPSKGSGGRLKPRHSVPWSPEEEQTLVEQHVALGSKWSQIARLLSTRTENDVKVGRRCLGA